MNSLGLFGIFASSFSDKSSDPFSYIFRTITLLLVEDLAYLLPYTTRMLGIRSCGVLLSYMWYTKQLLFCPYSCFGLIEMLDYSGLP